MNEPKSGTVKINFASSQYQSLFKACLDTIEMSSGFVTLEPGQSVGKHTTGSREEIIVVLEGEGKFLLNSGIEMELRYGVIAYCPPETEHDVQNCGETNLKYVYIVSEVHHQV